MRCIDDEIPFEIPDSWAWCRIRDISQSYIGLTYSPSEVSNNGVVVLRSSNIKDGKIVLNDIVRVSKDNISDKLFVSENDILICARNGSKRLVGKSAKIPALSEKMVFGAFMAVCKTQFYDFVYSFLQSSLFYNQLNNVSGTTTINQLTQNNFNGFIIPIPPLTEQKRIVLKLEELSLLLSDYNKLEEEDASLSISLPNTLNKSILQCAIQGKLVVQDPTDEPASVLLERIREEKKRLVKEKKIKADKNESTIYKGDDNSYYEKIGSTVRCIDDELPFELPENWCWCRLGNIGSWGAGSTPLRAKLDYYKGGTIPWLKTGELNNSIVYDTKERITELALKECSLRLVKANDVLIAMYGATIGKLAIAGAEMTTNQACCACTPLEDVNYLFLFYLLFANKEALIKQGEGGAQPNISREKIVSFLVGLPPINEQIRIVGKLNEIREML